MSNDNHIFSQNELSKLLKDAQNGLYSSVQSSRENLSFPSHRCNAVNLRNFSYAYIWHNS